MQCVYADKCGGCPYRHMSDDEYREFKQNNLTKLLKHLHSPAKNIGSPLFIGDGQRRRAAMSFEYIKGKIILGFNEASSHKIINIEQCLILTPAINAVLPELRELLSKLCARSYQIKRGKKLLPQHIQKGTVWISEVSNGLDIVLEYDAPIDLNARMDIAEFCQNCADIIRLSHRAKADSLSETILQKAIPYITMGKFNVHIPAGTFLQASGQSEQFMGNLVAKYLAGVEGKIADLFCGVGTFSYYIITRIPYLKVLAIDSGDELLQGFKNTLNAGQICNITIKKQNLFKYPLTSDEVSTFKAIVFDPPRSGAKEQCRQIALAAHKPATIIAVSCNPNTFINDANTLIDAGYVIEELTLVDQFAYSEHSELVANFCLIDNHK